MMRRIVSAWLTAASGGQPEMAAGQPQGSEPSRLETSGERGSAEMKTRGELIRERIGGGSAAETPRRGCGGCRGRQINH